MAYAFTLRAPASVAAIDLQRFLMSVEDEAQAIGFEPTLTFGLEFKSRKQRVIASRLRIWFPIAADKLKGATPRREQVLDWQPPAGRWRVLPDEAQILVLVNEAGAETAFGFGLYPETLNDANGHPLLKIPVGGRWHFSGVIKSPDPRYRNIVKRFSAAGYVEAESDDF